MGTSLVRPNRTGAASRGLQTLFHAGSHIGVSDGQLLERSALRDGQQSETAFAALVDRHGPLVWRTCRAVLRDEHEAADAFQATFLVLVRARLREALIRRGVVPSAVPVVTSRDVLAAFADPARALTASTIRSSVLFAFDTNMTAGVVSKTAILLAEGVVRAMIRAKLQSATLVMLAAFGLLVPAWLAHARQAPVDPAQAKAPAAGRKIAVPAVDFEGNWIVRVYPGGQAAALIGIEGPPQQPHAKLLSVGDPKFSDLARSKVDHLRIDERTVRFTLQRFIIPRKNTQSIEIIAYRHEDHAKPSAHRGSWIDDSGLDGRGTVLPVALERINRFGLDSKDWATGPGQEDFQRYNQTKDRAEKKEILDQIMKKYRDTPIAPVAAWCLAIDRADARAPEEEVRTLIDQTARIAARHGREMEIGAINLLVDTLKGPEEREKLILEYARKAAAMLHPADPAALQIPTLKNLAGVLRKAARIDKNKAMVEAKALDERISTLARRAGHEPVLAQQAETGIRSENIPWARNFAAARTQASEGRGQADPGRVLQAHQRLVQAARCPGLHQPGRGGGHASVRAGQGRRRGR
jgi:hypothetical protein